jgi:hypothetical protein
VNPSTKDGISRLARLKFFTTLPIICPMHNLLGLAWKYHNQRNHSSSKMGPLDVSGWVLRASAPTWSSLTPAVGIYLPLVLNGVVKMEFQRLDTKNSQ